VHRSLLACLLALLAPALIGCVGSGVGVPYPDPDEVGGAATTFEEIQTNIFDARCAPACHSGGGASRGLSLERGLSIRSLVEEPSNEVPELLRIAPGRSIDSYLIVKVLPSDGRRVGNRMPRNGPPFLSNAEIRGLRRWIDAGATEDWIDDGEDLDVDDDDCASPFQFEEAG